MVWGLWFIFWLTVFTVIIASTVILVAPIDRDGRKVQYLTKWWARNILRVMCVPVEVQGLEHLTPGQAYVFAANHRSDFDIFTLLAFLPGRIMFVAKKSLFQIPLFGAALDRMGSVSLDRDSLKEAMKSLDQAAERIRAGASMIIYPEGTRVPTPELIPFKKGVFIMASKAGQPVVPVSINGTRYIKSRDSLRVKPGPVKVIISPPINPQDFRRKEDLMAKVFQAIDANYDPYYPYGPDSAQ
ncbi:MAG: 1-acyl-sn-glycerol-3-phosphate acyltransferase [Deltaproteobacteria bacterium]|nr:1-acyl-sn-glycerol-3-phosphate acyltransferase [Deltaproteobacteria bacterium]